MIIDRATMRPYAMLYGGGRARRHRPHVRSLPAASSGCPEGQTRHVIDSGTCPQFLRRARRSKARLAQELSGQPWFAGIAIVPQADGFAVRVTVDRAAGMPPAELPAQLDGVPVQLMDKPDYEVHGPQSPPNPEL